MKKRMSASIETRVELEPGHLYVSAYENYRVSGDDIKALDRAIKEAQRYIAQVRKIKAYVKKHGIGVAPARTGYASPNLGQEVVAAWLNVMKKKPEDTIFNSRQMFEDLR